MQLPAITIDIKRIHEFVETIQPNGKCQVTNFEGQVKELTVTPRTVALALQLQIGGVSVKERRPSLKVYHKKSKLPSFKEIINADAVTLTQIFSQCLTPYNKRPVRFTTPHGFVVTTLTWAMGRTEAANIDFAAYIHEGIVNMQKKAPKHIGGGEMITRIIYEALDKTDQLVPGPSQTLWLELVEDFEDEQEDQEQAPPSHTTIGGRKLEKVPRETMSPTPNKTPTQGDKSTSGKEESPMDLGKRKREPEKVSVEQKRTKMERLMEGFARQRLLKGEIAQEKWKPSSSTFLRVRTKNPSKGFFDDVAWEEYIQEHIQTDEPEVKLKEEDLHEMKELLQHRPTPEESTTPSQEGTNPSPSHSEESQSSKHSRHTEKSHTSEKTYSGKTPSSEDRRLPTPPVSQGPGNTERVEENKEEKTQEVDQPQQLDRTVELNDLDTQMIQNLTLRIRERARNTEFQYAQTTKELTSIKQKVHELQKEVKGKNMTAILDNELYEDVQETLFECLQENQTLEMYIQDTTQELQNERRANKVLREEIEDLKLQAEIQSRRLERARQQHPFFRS